MKMQLAVQRNVAIVQMSAQRPCSGAGEESVCHCYSEGS